MHSLPRLIYVGWLVLHVFIVCVICTRETLWLINQRLTIVPACETAFEFGGETSA
ncbi:MAG TPA: hypothetical protein VGI60_09980 [Chthoniobacterales bacterium]|jgi:hypothetical protein